MATRTDLVIDDYLHSLAAATRRTYGTVWRQWVTWLADTHFTDPTKARRHHVQEYLEKLAANGHARGSLNSAKVAINRVYRALVRGEVLTVNPASEATQPTAGKLPRTPVLTDDEVGVLLRSLGKETWKERRDRVCVILLRESGWWRADVARLRVEDIHDGAIAGQVKGNKQAQFHIPKWVAGEIESWRKFAGLDKGALLPRSKTNPDPISGAIVYELFVAAAKRAGLPKEKRSPNALRRAVTMSGDTHRNQPGRDGSQSNNPESSKRIDDQVASALEALGPDLVACYRQGVLDLFDHHRVSYVGPAAELREVLSWVLHKLAPDDAVKAMDGWKPETKDNRPTRRQRSEYILTTRAKAKPGCRRALETLSGLDGLAGDLYERVSRATHTTAGDKDHLITYVTYLNGLLRDLLL